jgi:hypothetical protein
MGAFGKTTVRSMLHALEFILNMLRIAFPFPPASQLTSDRSVYHSHALLFLPSLSFNTFHFLRNDFLNNIDFEINESTEHLRNSFQCSKNAHARRQYSELE